MTPDASAYAPSTASTNTSAPTRKNSPNAIADAAREAARQASIARTPAQAQADALSSAQSVLAADHLDCTPQVTVDTAGFAIPPGEPAQVTVQVTCDVRLSGLTLIPGIPGSRPLTATFTSPLDIYRARGLGFSNSEGSSGANPSAGGA